MRPKKKIIRLKGKAREDLFTKVFERDDYTCQNPECPGGFPIDKAPHHIEKLSQGGSDVEKNLITLCIYCHGKEHGNNYVRS